MPGKILVDVTPLRESRDFRLMFIGQLVSTLGTQLTVVAIPYQVFRMTHSSLQVGAISLAQLIPLVIGSLAAGPIGDAVDRRMIMLSTREGLRYLRTRQVLQGVYIVDINAMVFGMPRALFPAMAESVFGGGTITLGLLYAAPGAGALIGALTTGWVTHTRRQGAAVILAVVVWGLAIAAFGFTDTIWIALVLLGVAGWADVVSAVLRNTILQTTIPDRFRSRLSSIQMAVVQGGPRLGDMESGTVATLTSIEFSVVSGGLACVVGAAVIALLMPQFRRHDAEEFGLSAV